MKHLFLCLGMGILTVLLGLQMSHAINFSGTTPWSTISRLNIHSTTVLIYLDVTAPANGCASPVFRVSASASGEGLDFHCAALLSAKHSQTEVAFRYDLDDIDDCKINIDTIYVK
ncbi:MAG: hypothetical protein AAFW60_07940 [Pseudomonadota bacterium]